MHSEKAFPSGKAFLMINKAAFTSLGMHEGAEAPSYEIRSSDMRGAREQSLPRPVGETGRRSSEL